MFRNQDRILVAPGYDDVKREHFFRPLGGALEAGESAIEALRREIHEELGVSIENPVQLGVLDNQFIYRGAHGHETVFVFDAAFADPQLYASPNMPILEAGWDGPARWLNLKDPFPAPLYPNGLTALLGRSA